MKKLLTATIAASLLLICASCSNNNSHSSGADFGMVDMQQIIQNSGKIKAMEASFKQQVKPLQEKLQKESQQMQALRKDSSKADDLKTAQDQFEKDLTSFQALQKKQQQQMKTLLMSSIDQVRTEHHLDAIFIKQVILASDKKEFIDVTDAVEKKLSQDQSKTS